MSIKKRKQSKELQEKRKKWGKQLAKYMLDNPEAKLRREESLRKSWMETKKKRIKTLLTHPNIIASRFKKGDDIRRYGKRNFSKENRDAQAERMRKIASQQIRENHPNWKGGVGGEAQLIRNSKKHLDWAKRVYAKDHYRCKECGTHCRKGNIVAHHIKSFVKYPKLRFDINNGETYCRSHHTEWHKKIKAINNLINILQDN